MHRAIGNKVASLPLGSFRADTAGKTSRLVSRELMVLGEIFAHMYSPLIAAIVTSATMLVGIAAFSPTLGVVCLVAIPIVGGGVWVARRCLQSGAALKEPPARELSHRIVEYATKQGALRACGRSASYEPLQRAEDAYGVAARRSLMRETVGQVVNGMAAQVVVVSLIMCDWDRSRSPVASAPWRPSSPSACSCASRRSLSTSGRSPPRSKPGAPSSTSATRSSPPPNCPPPRARGAWTRPRPRREHP